jgi:4-hydroxy-tetrahydrodipicolinate reductase
MKIALFGATGRMGQALTRLIAQAPDLELVGAACAANDPAVGQDVGTLAGVGTLGVEASPDAAAALLGAEVVIDFSNASAVSTIAALASRDKVALVSCTTGLEASAQSALERAAEQVPVLWAPNTSLGVQVLAEVVEQALRRLGSDYDAEIVEIHHRKKLDSPSGTAKRLADAVRAVRPNIQELHGRDGMVGARTDDEVAVLGVRGGDVVGDHTVYLFGPGERLELTHRASSRELFAHGALKAARFVVKQKPGKLYRIADVLG